MKCQAISSTAVIDFVTVLGENWTQLVHSWDIVYIPLIIRSFNRYLLSVGYMPGIFRGLGKIQFHTKWIKRCLQAAYSPVGEKNR